jgi:NAD-dependent dihydropyrimidine dehydrogenase PreA subunit
LSIKGRIKAWAHGGSQAFVTAPNACAACGECVRACPEKAITLVRRSSTATPSTAKSSCPRTATL